VDQKGRLKIPATFATPFKEMGAACFITSEDGDCARIYPLPIWNEIEKRLMRRSQDDQQKRNLLLRAKYFGQTVNIDDQGGRRFGLSNLSRSVESRAIRQEPQAKPSYRPG
jgi:MraZ protein